MGVLGHLVDFLYFSVTAVDIGHYHLILFDDAIVEYHRGIVGSIFELHLLWRLLLDLVGLLFGEVEDLERMVIETDRILVGTGRCELLVLLHIRKTHISLFLL